MKKLICIILGLFLFTCSYGQAIINRSGPANTVQDARWMSQYNAFLPRYNDTTAANLQKGIDSCGAIIFTYDIAALWFRSCSNGSKQWVQILPAGSPTPGGQAWVNPINNNLFTDASNNGSFGTFGPNGIYFKTNNTTRWYLDRNGIAPETGTSVGIGIDPLDSNRITYFSGGGGSTPTWQQTLTAGSTLNTDNTVDGGGNTFNFVNNNILQFGATSSGAGSLINIAQNSNGGSVTSNIVLNDSISLTTSTGKYYLSGGILNVASQNNLLGIVTSTGQAGRITLGTGLSLSSGVLSNTGSESVIVGDWINTTFPGSSLPSGWSSYIVTPSVSDGVTVPPNGGNICDGFIYNTKYNASLNYTTTLEFTLNTKPTSYTDGFFVGRRSNSSQLVQNAFVTRVVTSSTWRIVPNIIYGCSYTQVDSTEAIPMANGNKYRIYIAGSNSNIYVKFSLLNSIGEDSVTAAVNYKYLYNADAFLQPANTGSEWIGAIGSVGSYKVTSIVTKHYDYLNSNVLFVGNSIGVRYNSTNVRNHYSYLAMDNSNKTWANQSGGGDELSDIMQRKDEIIQIAPTYCIIENVNTPAADLRADLTALIDTLQAHGITPIFLKLFSVTAKDTVAFNVCKEQGVQLVDANRPNQPLSTTDGVHPDDLGMQQIAYILKSECPLVTGSTGGRELYTLNGLGDVYNTSLSNNDILKWNSANKRWQNAASPTPSLTSTYVGVGSVSNELSGSSSFTYDGALMSLTGAINASTGIRVQGFNVPASGAGLEFGYYSGGPYGYLYTYNRSGGAYISTVIGRDGNQIFADAGGNVGIANSSPTSSLDNGGSLGLKYTSSAVDISANATHCVIELTATGKTVTLPTAVGITGRIYTVKLTASGTGTVATTSSQNIDGSTTYSLASQYKYVTVQSNGSGWIVIANN